MKPYLLLGASLLSATLSLSPCIADDTEIRRDLRGYQLIREIENVAQHADNGSTLALYRGVTKNHRKTSVLSFEIWKSSELFIERYFFTAGRLSRVRTLTFPYAYDYNRQQLDPSRLRLSRSELIDLASQKQRLILDIDGQGKTKRTAESVSLQQIEQIKTEFRRWHALFAHGKR